MADDRPFDILLVEDNPGDVRLVIECLVVDRLQAGEQPSRIRVAVNGVDALKVVRGHGSYAGAPRPDIILLDLNLPMMDGREVLAALKADPDLRRIPVIVFTSSAADVDILRCYDLHANCFVTKPVDLDEFMTAVRGISEFWLKSARLPPPR